MLERSFTFILVGSRRNVKTLLHFDGWLWYCHPI